PHIVTHPLVNPSPPLSTPRHRSAPWQMSIMFPAPSPGREGEVQLTVRDFPGPLKYHTVAPQLMQLVAAARQFAAPTAEIVALGEGKEGQEDAFQTECVDSNRLCVIGMFNTDSPLDQLKQPVCDWSVQHRLPTRPAQAGGSQVAAGRPVCLHVLDSGRHKALASRVLPLLGVSHEDPADSGGGEPAQDALRRAARELLPAHPRRLPRLAARRPRPHLPPRCEWGSLLLPPREEEFQIHSLSVSSDNIKHRRHSSPEFTYPKSTLVSALFSVSLSSSLLASTPSFPQRLPSFLPGPSMESFPASEAAEEAAEPERSQRRWVPAAAAASAAAAAAACNPQIEFDLADIMSEQVEDADCRRLKGAQDSAGQRMVALFCMSHHLVACTFCTCARCGIHTGQVEDADAVASKEHKILQVSTWLPFCPCCHGRACGSCWRRWADAVSVEALANKTVAVDASIWLVQFLKAMRDDRGELLPGAHLLGFLRRVCKLLFLRIRPLIVLRRRHSRAQAPHRPCAPPPAGERADQPAQDGGEAAAQPAAAALAASLAAEWAGQSAGTSGAAPNVAGTSRDAGAAAAAAAAAAVASVAAATAGGAGGGEAARGPVEMEGGDDGSDEDSDEDD
ncbi:unnamed protein product, partial [Closterium sp. NIES-64]